VARIETGLRIKRREENQIVRHQVLSVFGGGSGAQQVVGENPNCRTFRFKGTQHGGFIDAFCTAGYDRSPIVCGLSAKVAAKLKIRVRGLTGADDSNATLVQEIAVATPEKDRGCIIAEACFKT